MHLASPILTWYPQLSTAPDWSILIQKSGKEYIPNTSKEKVVGFGGHIQIHNVLRFNDTDPYFITADDSLIAAFKKIKGVRHVERYTITQGLLKTESDFLGIAFKGVGPEFDSTFLKQNLVEGRIPKFSDTSSHYELLLSKIFSPFFGATCE